MRSISICLEDRFFSFLTTAVPLKGFQQLNIHLRNLHTLNPQKHSDPSNLSTRAHISFLPSAPFRPPERIPKKGRPCVFRVLSRLVQGLLQISSGSPYKRTNYCRTFIRKLQQRLICISGAYRHPICWHCK